MRNVKLLKQCIEINIFRSINCLLFSILLSVSFVGDVSSAEVYVNKFGNIVLSGSIRKGDYAKIEALYYKSEMDSKFLTLELDSPGGNLEESLKISHFVNFRHMSTMTLKRCMSGCAIIFFSGKHYAATSNAVIGLHKPYLSVDNTVSIDQIRSNSWWRIYGVLVASLKDENLAKAILGFMYSTEDDEFYRIDPKRYDKFKIITN